MGKNTAVSLDHFMDGLKKRNPGQTEFQQAVYEVSKPIFEFITDSIKQPLPPSVGKTVRAGNRKNLVLKFKPKGGHYVFRSLEP